MTPDGSKDFKECLSWLHNSFDDTWLKVLSRFDSHAPDRHAVRYTPLPDEMHMLRHCLQGYEDLVDQAKFTKLYSRVDGHDPSTVLPVWATQLIASGDTYLRTQRIIVSAALRVTHHGSPIIIPSSRHCSPIAHRLYEEMGFREFGWPHGDDQGFIDNFDNYWTRKEAMSIARVARQVKFDTNGGDGEELYSEGLY